MNMDRIAGAVLRLLCQKRGALAESAIVEELIHQGVATEAEAIAPVFDLLLRDHYLSRSISKGKRMYRFKYEIMRRWWHLNRG
jgi:hypothetical protein